MLECRGSDVAARAGLGIRSVSERHQLYSKTIFGCRSGSAGVLVMESQSERRRRLATPRKRKQRDTRTAEKIKLNNLQKKKARSKEFPQAR